MQPEQFSYNFFIAKHPIDNDAVTNVSLCLMNVYTSFFLYLFIFATSVDFIQTSLTCETLRFELVAHNILLSL